MVSRSYYSFRINQPSISPLYTRAKRPTGPVSSHLLRFLFPLLLLSAFNFVIHLPLIPTLLSRYIYCLWTQCSAN
jgi:hypothetical protein